MFGQLVIGSPGAGKTTYCAAMQQLLQRLGRKVAIINLDPANDEYTYDCALDLADLVSLDAVQENLHLGPNGGMLYCIDYLAENVDWLLTRIQQLQSEKYNYFLIDCPGQVELFTIHNSLRKVIDLITGAGGGGGGGSGEEGLEGMGAIGHEPREGAATANATATTDPPSSSSDPPIPPSTPVSLSSPLRLTAVHLIDSTLCTDAAKFISACLLSLSTMLHLELPHINVLSKVDVLERITANENQGFDIEMFTNLEDPSVLLGLLSSSSSFSSPFFEKYRALSAALVDIVDQYGLVSFAPLNVQDGRMMEELLEKVDTANGFAFLASDDDCAGGQSRKISRQSSQDS